ncbi:NHLP bacteriocin system secretion protein [Paraburkholderia humisilvae]|uniref:Membrane fusion protein biotin-lipoyl like domain-containing protein n=1 Tax=Paraburkholderia humisilvae TaxID=627669 RepID=A0A6J5FBA3_9BURK|nr:NHLP bacteriocin system secretion protein [Paraburkholderia humisilvae]CAB3774495.1 hypothetical protein LMG29542_07872 [Paraburkholderia humisilvae]
MVRSPLYRSALAAFVLLGMGTVIWGLFGSIPRRIQGFGEVVSTEGLHSITSPATGQVASIVAYYGKSVRKGDVLLRLKQPDIAGQIDSLKTQIKTVSAELDILRTGDKQNSTVRDRLRSLDYTRLEAQLAGANSQIEFLDNQLLKQRQLLAQGYVLRSTVNDTAQALSTAKVERDQIRTSIRQQSLDQLQWQMQTDMTEKVKANQLLNLQEQLAVLNDQYARSTVIRADRSGRVIAVNIADNVVAQRGQSLIVLEEDGASAPYQFVLYVPYTADDRIAPGMRVDVGLLTVDHNLYGWLVGKVVNVDDFVSTADQLRNNLQNDLLIGKITATGPVYRVEIELQRDSSTTSGYAWTSRKGPPYRIDVGSLGNAYVHVQDKAPVDYLIPTFKKLVD